MKRNKLVCGPPPGEVSILGFNACMKSCQSRESMSSIKSGKVGEGIWVSAWKADLVVVRSIGVVVYGAARSLDRREHCWHFGCHLGAEQKISPWPCRAAHIRDCREQARLAEMERH